MTQDLSDLKLEEWERIALEANVAQLKWLTDLAPTDEVLAIDESSRGVSVVAKVNPMAEWDDPTAAAWSVYISAFQPRSILSLLSALKEAREALRPFAKIAGHLTSCAYGPAWGFNGGVVEHEDFLKARKAFTTIGGSDEQAE